MDFFIGVHRGHKDPLAFYEAVDQAIHLGYEMAVLNTTRQSASRLLFQDELAWQEQDAFQSNPSFDPSDVYIDTPRDETASILANASDWLDFDSSNLETINNSCLVLTQECSWMAHIGIHVILMDLPVSPAGTCHLARCLGHILDAHPYTQPILRVPLAPIENNTDWTKWTTLYALCNENERVKLSLVMHADLPDEVEWKRWLAEPLHSIVVPTSTFLTNPTGFPVLSRQHQRILRMFIKHGVAIIIQDDTDATKLEAYPQYMNHLKDTLPEPEIVEKYAQGYHDYLQSPLQPLMNNLDASTYHIFQLDPVKYVQYEKAVYQALMDSKPFWKDDYVPVIMVVGAGGHGPLVDCCIRAAASSNTPVHLYAIEKNPNAIITLKQKKQSVWHDTVELVFTDMRHWDNPVKADILVSELLGSFGDNELSPECLDGAQRLLKSTGISIPESYSSYVAPLSSYRLHGQVSKYKDIKSFETPYVVMFKAVHEHEAQFAWKFSHPFRDAHGRMQPPPSHNMHNWRFSQTMFSVTSGEMCHGLGGYFDTVLYKDVVLSIEPKTHSKGMFSWFPIYFPLQVPVYLPSGSQVTVSMWRLSDGKKVWYEWSLQVHLGDQPIYTSAIHNPQGRSSWIGL